MKDYLIPFFVVCAILAFWKRKEIKKLWRRARGKDSVNMISIPSVLPPHVHTEDVPPEAGGSAETEGSAGELPPDTSVPKAPEEDSVVVKTGSATIEVPAAGKKERKPHEVRITPSKPLSESLPKKEVWYRRYAKSARAYASRQWGRFVLAMKGVWAKIGPKGSSSAKDAVVHAGHAVASAHKGYRWFTKFLGSVTVMTVCALFLMLGAAMMWLHFQIEMSDEVNRRVAVGMKDEREKLAEQRAAIPGEIEKGVVDRIDELDLEWLQRHKDGVKAAVDEANAKSGTLIAELERQIQQAKEQLQENERVLKSRIVTLDSENETLRAEIALAKSKPVSEGPVVVKESTASSITITSPDDYREAARPDVEVKRSAAGSDSPPPPPPGKWFAKVEGRPAASPSATPPAAPAGTVASKPPPSSVSDLYERVDGEWKLKVDGPNPSRDEIASARRSYLGRRLTIQFPSDAENHIQPRVESNGGHKIKDPERCYIGHPSMPKSTWMSLLKFQDLVLTEDEKRANMCLVYFPR